MTIQLLPDDFDDLLVQAVQLFWGSRASVPQTLDGSRRKVLSGRNMDGFPGVVRTVARHCGVIDEAIITEGRAKLSVPGYYRPTKIWDVVIIYQGRLLAVMEFKSQVGSFGNNFNNRSEEAIGSAEDLRMAVATGEQAGARSFSALPSGLRI